MFVLDEHPDGSPKEAVESETALGNDVTVVILLTTDVTRSKFVFCYLHTRDRSKSGDEFAFC